jgi:hypothetical protein
MKKSKGYYGFPSKAAYEKYYSDPKLYAAEIPAMEAYVRDSEAQRIIDQNIGVDDTETGLTEETVKWMPF